MRSSRGKADWNKAPAAWHLQIITGTPVGAVAVICSGRRLLRVMIGLAGETEVRRHVESLAGVPHLSRGESEGARQVREYFSGVRRSFELDPVLDGLGPFHQKALRACAGIPFGGTATYGEISRAAGSPRAFRAVGQALKRNPCAIVIPCHRVVGANGIGGFSAPGGIDTKRALLEFEGIEGPALKARVG